MKRISKLLMIIPFIFLLFGCNNTTTKATTTDDTTITTEERKYIIEFVNYDGTLLKRYNGLEKDSYPYYVGENPSKPCAEEGYYYDFVGWDKPIDYVKEDVTYTAQFEKKPIRYNITYGNASAADNPNPEYYTVEDGTIPLQDAVSRTGLTFSGWNYNGSRVTSIDCSLMQDIKLDAIWGGAPVSHRVDLSKNIDEAGSITGEDIYQSGTSVTIEATTNPGYVFDGWYYKGNDSLLSNNPKYTFTVDKDYILVAKWKLAEHKVNISSDVSSISYEGITDGNDYSYGSKLKLTLSNIPNGKVAKMSINGHIIVGLSYSFVMPNEDVEIKIIGLVDTPYTKVNNSTYLFGTYPQSLVTNESLIEGLNGSISIPKIIVIDDIDYVYETGNYYEIIDGEKYLIDSNYIVIDETKIFVYYDWSKCNYNGQCNMWYLDLDADENGFYDYRAVYFSDYSTTSKTIQNNYITNSIYWFKYDSIKWNVLNDNEGKLLLVSDLLLDNQCFLPGESHDGEEFEHNGGTGYANNYELSYIRKWLNDEFYKVAFYGLDENIVSEILINNSKETTINESEYACNDTFDKVSLLSYQDVSTYYSSDSNRMAYSSDYAKAMGLYVYSNNCSSWLTRSPRSNNTYDTSTVMYNGFLVGSPNDSVFGVRPIIYLFV